MLEIFKNVALSIAVVGFGLAVLVPALYWVFSFYEKCKFAKGTTLIDLLMRFLSLMLYIFSMFLFLYYFIATFYFIWG